MSFVTIMYCWTGLSVAIVVGLLVNDLRLRLIERWQEHKMRGLIVSYNIAPVCETPAEFEDFFDMVDLSDDEGWIEDGIEQLSIHSTICQKHQRDLEDAA